MPAADREEVFTITVPAKTKSTAPAETQTRFHPGEVVEVEVLTPAGAAGLTGWRIASSKQQVIPNNTGTWIIGDNEVFKRETVNYPNSGDFQFIAYNEDIYNHTFQVRFSIRETQKLTEAPGSSEGVTINGNGEVVLESSGEGEPTPTSPGSPSEGEAPPPDEAETPPEGSEPPETEPSTPPAPPTETPPAGEAPPEVEPPPVFTGSEQGSEPEVPLQEVKVEESPEVQVEGAIETPEAIGSSVQKITTGSRKGAKKVTKKKLVKKTPAKKKPAPKRKPAGKAKPKGKKPPAVKSKPAPKRTAAGHAGSKRTPPAGPPSPRKAPPKQHTSSPHAPPSAPPKRAPASHPAPPAHKAPAPAKRSPPPPPHRAPPRPAPPRPRPAPPPPPPPPRRAPPPPPKRKR